MKCVSSGFAALASLVVLAPLVHAQLTMNIVPSREFGQHALANPLNSFAPNLVEGRELNNPSSIAFDTSVSPPIMYVADTGNNRVLAWRDPDSLTVCGTSAPPVCGLASLVIGQLDLFSTLPQGPSAGTKLISGLSGPTSVAVDGSGNLYVADGGNNRILRFPAPFNQTGPLQPELVIGQSSATAGSQPNQGKTQPSAQTVAFCCGSSGQPLRSGLAFDPAGNLWVADPGNNRVLRFPGPNTANNQLAANTALPAADIVLGQFDFVTGTLNPTALPTTPASLNAPLGVAIDSNGGLYVLDSFSRVLYFTPSITSPGPVFQNGQSATRILGLVPTPATGQSALTYPNQYSLGMPSQPPPQGIFILANALYVCDSSANRIVHYDLPANWPAATSSTPSPPILGVIGQADLGSGQVNKGQPQPDATTLNAPVAGSALNGELWVADASNNRVLAYAPASTSATRVVGQLDFPFNSVNLIEGREVFFSPQIGAAGIAVDTTSTPPHLYLSDAQNNRILGFNDARNVQPGTRADIVIGQPDFFRALVNYPSGNGLTPTNSGLQNPTAIAVDAQGNLLVADTGNSRVLRFPSPFSQPAGTLQAANLVLGQPGFALTIPDATQRTMRAPVGLALFSDGSLAVSDDVFSRVLLFQRPPNGDFSNGQLALVVLGQPDFSSTVLGASTSNTGLAGPRHVAVDPQNRLYVCDPQNNRVMIFSSPLTSANGAPATFQIGGLTFPIGVAVSPTNGDFWVADANSQKLLHFPPYNALIGGSQSSDQTIPSPVPLAITLDSFGNLIAAELVNRVSFYFPVLAYRNTANYNNQPVPPGSLIYVARPGVDFSFTPASPTSSTYPTTLGGLQVSMNGTTLCPIYLVTSTSVYFQVPASTPTSGFADFQVIDAASGQIYADSEVPMGPANPGFYTINAQGFGQAAALNVSDGTVNGPSNPVPKDGTHYIQFYLTGLGAVQGAPPDGVPPPSPIPAPQQTTFLATGCLNGVCPPSSVSFSGLAVYPGVWIINFLVPNTFPASCNNVIAVIYDNFVSNVGPNGKLQVTFCTK